MSQYKPYPAYKDSGVEWLGRVPEHWEVMAIKHIVSTPITDGPHETPEFLDDGIPFVSAEAVSTGKVDFEKIRGFISREDHERYSQKYCPQRGDIFMIKSGATTGVTAIVDTDEEFNIWSPLAVIRCGERSVPYFVLNFMRSRSFQEAVALSWSYGTQQNIGMGVIGNLAMTVPPQEEQRAIAGHLDHETARIDALIEKKTRFIELLREKRQALITHAVTKGLDPNVKMKDSGVEWLGEVPGHWRVMAIKHVVATPITDGPHETPEFFDEGVPFVSAEAVSSGWVDFLKIRGFISRVDHERYARKYCPQRGDIFMIKSGATTGVTAIVETDEEFNIWSPLAVIRCGEVAEPYFVLNFMRSRCFQEAIALSWSYGTQQNIGMGVIGSLAVTVPPLEEQKDIARIIQARCHRLDVLVDKTERSITLLKERRSALITAAVTGQIDLREAV